MVMGTVMRGSYGVVVVGQARPFENLYPQPCPNFSLFCDKRGRRK